MSNNRKYYVGFDYLRFVCCILILMLHTNVITYQRISAKKNSFSIIYSMLSGGVYFVHRAVLGTFVLLGFISGSGWFSFGIVLVICCLLCWMAHKSNNKYIKAVFGIT